MTAALPPAIVDAALAMRTAVDSLDAALDAYAETPASWTSALAGIDEWRRTASRDRDEAAMDLLRAVEDATGEVAP